MTPSEAQRVVNDKFQGKYILYNGVFKGICKEIICVGPPSGFNKQYWVKLANGYEFSLTNTRLLKAVTAKQLHEMKKKEE